VVIGEFRRTPLPRTHTLAATFRAAGVTCDVTGDLARAHWEKLVWNIPFNGLGVAGIAGYEALLSGIVPGDPARLSRSCLPTDVLLADPRWARLVVELMHEVIAAANLIGHNVPASHAKKLLALTRTMGAYKASTLLDFEKGLPLELESLFGEPLRRAQAIGAATPRLAALCAVLGQVGPPAKSRT